MTTIPGGFRRKVCPVSRSLEPSLLATIGVVTRLTHGLAPLFWSASVIAGTPAKYGMLDDVCGVRLSVCLSVCSMLL